MSVRWRPEAIADVALIARHIAAENPIAARRVAREILLAGDSLGLFPRRGRPGQIAGTRELVPVQPYVIVYEVEGEAVTILRVWHAARERGGEG